MILLLKYFIENIKTKLITKIILNIENLQTYRVAWSPHIFSDRISRFMIKYSMKKKTRDKTIFKKKLSKIIYKGINV